MTNQQPQKLTKPKLEAIRKQAHKNMRLIMKKLNFKGSDYGDRLVGCCPNPHKGSQTPNDNPNAFSWDFSRQMWQCFSNKCHNIYGSDVFALIRCVKRCSFMEAVNWIAEVTGNDIDAIKELDHEESLRMEQIIRKRSELVKHKQAEEAIMRHLRPSNYFKQRGFSEKVIQEFGCGGEWHKAGTYGENRAVVPVYDPIDGYLIAFTCRLLNDDLITSKCPKWSHCLNFAEIRKRSADKTDEERFHASSVLYNLHRAKEHMGEDGTIIITEGPGDVMRFWEAGMKNAVACLGTSFSKNHKKLLHQIGCRRVICVLDGDAAGHKATGGVKKLCSNYFEYHEVVMPEGKDPGGTDPSQLRMLFKDFLEENDD